MFAESLHGDIVDNAKTVQTFFFLKDFQFISFYCQNFYCQNFVSIKLVVNE